MPVTSASAPAPPGRQRFALSVLGVEVAFRSEADPARIEWARAFIEEQYRRLEERGKQAGREQLLILLVMGIADSMLQSQQDLVEVRQRIEHLLVLMEKTGIA
jgi:cell division protein ZapA